MAPIIRSCAGVLALAAVWLDVCVWSQGSRDQTGSSSTTPAFVDGTRAAGLDFVAVNGASAEKHLAETMGSGVALFDYDNDGWVDIFLVDGGSLAMKDVAARARHRLYRNRGDGTFVDVTATSGVRHQGYGMGVCAADVDNDGRVDIYITGVGSNSLWRNNGDGTFTDITARADVGRTVWSTGCAFADLDRDGDLDLFVTNYVDAPVTRAPFCGDARQNVRQYCHPLNYTPLSNLLYRNDGSGRFTDVSVVSGVAPQTGYGLGVVISDFDDDGWPDVFVANDSVPNFLFFNEGNLRFREAALPSGVAVAPDGRPRAGMGTDAADYDGDGRVDLIVTNHEFETHGLYRNVGGRLFSYVTTQGGLGAATLPFVGFGVAFFDFDNDGPLDIAIANGHVIDNVTQYRAGAKHAQRRLLFRNVTGRRFADVSRTSGPAFLAEAVGRGLVAGDIDNDGDLDLLVTNNGGRAELLLNSGTAAHNALLVHTVGTTSNRGGVGARVTLTIGTQSQVRESKTGSGYLGQGDPRLHFGMGRARRADQLSIRWPSGRVQTFQNLAANQIVTVTEGSDMPKQVAFAR